MNIYTEKNIILSNLIEQRGYMSNHKKIKKCL